MAIKRMLKILYIVIIEIILIATLPAQSLQQVKQFADDQLKKGNYTLALKEYQRVHYFDTMNFYTDINHKIATIYFKQESYDKAVVHLEMARIAAFHESEKNKIILEKAYCFLQNKEYYNALNELYGISEQSTKSIESNRNLYLGICYYGLDDTYESKRYLSSIVDSVKIVKIDSLFQRHNRFARKYRPRKIEIMSQLIPGLGQIYCGHMGNGINSMLLVGGSIAYSISTVSSYGFLDGILLFASLYRYMDGGAVNAKELARGKIKRNKREVYQKMISIIEEMD